MINVQSTDINSGVPTYHKSGVVSKDLCPSDHPITGPMLGSILKQGLASLDGQNWRLYQEVFK